MSEGISASMFKKLTGFLIRRKSGEITPAEAEKIQKASYMLNNAEIKKRYSPAYLSLIPGLDNPEKQICEASAWYLSVIAKNKPKYREHILEILNAKIKESSINPEFREYLKTQVHNVLSKNNP